MKNAIVFEAERTGYTLSQVYGAMTVGELRDFLEQYDDDTQIFISHDNGYTYGTISTCWGKMQEVDLDENDGIESERW